MGEKLCLRKRVVWNILRSSKDSAYVDPLGLHQNDSLNVEFPLNTKHQVERVRVPNKGKLLSNNTDSQNGTFPLNTDTPGRGSQGT